MLDHADKEGEEATLPDWHDSGLEGACMINFYHVSDKVIKIGRPLSRPTVGTPGGSYPMDGERDTPEAGGVSGDAREIDDLGFHGRGSAEEEAAAHLPREAGPSVGRRPREDG